MDGEIGNAAEVRPRVVLITGASRGYGRTLAETLAREAALRARTLRLVLVARDAADLQETEKVVALAASCAAGVSCSLHSVDLSDPLTIESLMEPAFASMDEQAQTMTPTPEVIAILNAGSVGSLQYTRDISAAAAVSAINLNVTGVVALTSAILRRFASTREDAPQLRIVNISSLLAVKEFPGLALYATGKAARDMLMRAVSVEAQARGEHVKTLSWAPGPMRTAMADEIRETCVDGGIRQMFTDMQYIDMRESAERLVMNLLHKDDYENAAHIDVYDVPEACRL